MLTTFPHFLLDKKCFPAYSIAWVIVRPVSGSASIPAGVFLLVPSFIAKFFKIRTSEKQACKLFGMNTSKTQDLKLFRMNTYEKMGQGGGYD